MAIVISDISSALWDFLKTNSEAANFRATVYGGEDGIYESGDVWPEVLQAALDARRAAGELTKVLCMDVQDAGEDPHPNPNTYVQYVIVRFYDRHQGYRNLRSSRVMLMDLLHKRFTKILTATRQRGVLKLSYEGRTGHRYDRDWDIEYESISYAAIIVAERG